MSNKNNTPAFPTQTNYYNKGMKLRDWFAGMAMSALITNHPVARDNPDYVAHWAYQNADAMIEERGKENSDE